MTAPKTRNRDRKLGRCRSCLSWDVARIREGPDKGKKVCLRCGHMEKNGSLGRPAAG